MKLSTTIQLYGGGPGSGRHPEWTADRTINDDPKFKYSVKVIQVPVNKVVGGEQMSYAQSYNADKVARYARKLQRGGKMDAIAVSKRADGKYVIRDGHHRWLAAKQVGLKTIGVHKFLGMQASQSGGSSQLGRRWKVVDTKYGHTVSDHSTYDEAENASLARPYSKVVSYQTPSETPEVMEIARQRMVQTNPDVT